MTQQDKPGPARRLEPRRPAATEPRDTPAAISSAALLAGGREVLIRHGDDEYRLRLTGNNKLILTK